MKREHVPRSAGGYVLFLVAGVIAAISLALLTVANVQGDVSPGVELARQDVGREIDAQTIAGRAAFLLLTEPIGPRSIIIGGLREADQSGTAPGRNMKSASGRLLQEVFLDGRSYRVRLDANNHPDGFLALQDEKGLLDLNVAGEAAIANLLAEAGVQRRTADVLAARLVDYIDQDDLRRNGGAETEAYRSAGRPGPANAALASRWQAIDALSWRELLRSEQHEVFWRNVGVATGKPGVNVNTAPGRVLQAIINDPRRVELVERRRALGPITSRDELEGMIGVATAADGPVLATDPGSRFRLLVGFDPLSSGRSRAVEGQIELSGADADRPFYWRDGWHHLAGGSDAQGFGRAGEFLPEGRRVRAP